MNSHGFNHLLLSVFGAIVLAVMFILSAFVLPSGAQARSSPLSVMAPINPAGCAAKLSHAPALAFTDAFTVHLPAAIKGPSIPPHPCAPGQTITDPADDVSIAHIDVTALSTALNAESLEATLHLRDVPPQLTFNRVGIPEDYLEYGWSVYVDTDNNPQTGSGSGPYKGAEYSLSARHYVFQPDSPVTLPIADGVQKNVWRYESTTGHWLSISHATLTVDPESDTMTLIGTIPGIHSGSRLIFYTYDRNPGDTGQMDTSSCSVSTGLDSKHVEIGM
jgi:hypothetical protein